MLAFNFEEAVYVGKQVSAVDALLNSDVVEEKDVYMPRLDTEFTVRTVTMDDIEEIEEQAKKFVEVRKGKRKEVRDEEKFGKLLIVKGCVNPTFADKKLLEHFGVSSAEEVVSKSLRVGEITKLATEIMRLSGFDDDEDALEEAKN